MNNIAVLLNRVFRLEDNPLLQTIIENKNNDDNIFLVLLQEDLSDASEIKQNFYYGTFERFLNALHSHGIKPHVMPYQDFINFCKMNEINHVLMAGDIMSYHRHEYDAPSMRKTLGEHDINVHLLKVNHYLTSSASMKKDGTPYLVFTPFYRAMRTQLRKQELLSYDVSELAKHTVHSKESHTFSYLESGTDEAETLEKWQLFLDTDIDDYNKNREYLSEVRTSQLSIAFAYGLLDIRKIINQLLENLEDNAAEYEAFIREIMFREFYYVLMTKFPEAAKEPFKEKYKLLKWSNNETYFEAWKKGETGYPIIDAAMRELKETGYMHNRCRMVVSAFLTKDLFIDWRWGEEYFRTQLIDYDNASNVHGWQWSASTGSDAVPYFRVFNPIRQSERFLGDGAYVRKFLPIFEGVPVKYIHEPIKYEAKLKDEFNITLGDDYPHYIVDHKTQRDHVINVFEKF